jgi:hypothetical protein
MDTDSESLSQDDMPAQNEVLGERLFADHLLYSLAVKLAAQFQDSVIPQDGTQPLSYRFEDSEHGRVEISDYYDRAHMDERMRSYLRKPNLDSHHLLMDGVNPIINFSVNDTQYAVFKPQDVDKTNGVGQLLTVALPEDIDPEKTIVTKSMRVVDNPADDPILQWLSKP